MPQKSLHDNGPLKKLRQFINETPSLTDNFYTQLAKSELVLFLWYKTIDRSTWYTPKEIEHLVALFSNPPEELTEPSTVELIATIKTINFQQQDELLEGLLSPNQTYPNRFTQEILNSVRLNKLMRDNADNLSVIIQTITESQPKSLGLGARIFNGLWGFIINIRNIFVSSPIKTPNEVREEKIKELKEAATAKAETQLRPLSLQETSTQTLATMGAPVRQPPQELVTKETFPHDAKGQSSEKSEPIVQERVEHRIESSR